jgi:hypothetical protein
MRRTLLFGLMVTFGACSSRSGARVDRCAGKDIRAIVTNRSTQMVDVVARISDGGSAVTIGTVAGGDRAEFTLPPGASGAFVRATDRGRGMLRNAVDIRFDCQ